MDADGQRHDSFVLRCRLLIVSIGTVWIFGILGVDISNWYARNVVVWGLVTAPLVAAYLARGRHLVSLASRIAGPFLPLVLVTLLAYLVVFARSGAAAFWQRDFLTSVNAILVGVAFIALAIICDRARRRDRAWIDFLNLALVAVTLLISSFALWAIVSRLLTHGLESTRLAVLGTDAVIFTLFTGVAWKYVQFISARVALSAAMTWIARYLPILPAWAAAVVFILPLDPIGWIAARRSRSLRAVSPVCLFVTHVTNLSIINTATNGVVATIDIRYGTPSGAQLAPDNAALYLPDLSFSMERIGTAPRASVGREENVIHAREIAFAPDGPFRRPAGVKLVTIPQRGGKNTLAQQRFEHSRPFKRAGIPLGSRGAHLGAVSRARHEALPVVGTRALRAVPCGCRARQQSDCGRGAFAQTRQQGCMAAGSSLSATVSRSPAVPRNADAEARLECGLHNCRAILVRVVLLICTADAQKRTAPTPRFHSKHWPKLISRQKLT